MTKVTVRIEGADELKAAIEGLRRAARGPILERAALKGAEVIRAEASGNAPGPHVEAEVTKAADLAVEVGIGPDAAHWYYQFFETGAGAHSIDPTKKKALAFPGREGQVVRFHVGHPGMAAKPFLRPAVDSQKDAAVQATGDELRKGIEAVARG